LAFVVFNEDSAAAKEALAAGSGDSFKSPVARPVPAVLIGISAAPALSAAQAVSRALYSYRGLRELASSTHHPAGSTARTTERSIADRCSTG